MSFAQSVTQLSYCVAAEDYAKAASQGYRPERTRVFTDELWDLVTSCWDQDPIKRPTMSLIVARLDNILLEVRWSGGTQNPYSLR